MKLKLKVCIYKALYYRMKIKLYITTIIVLKNIEMHI